MALKRRKDRAHPHARSADTDRVDRTDQRRATASMPTPLRKTADRNRREKTIDEIYERIYVAILEHRVQPGT